MAAAAIALSGIDVMHFWLAMVLVGVGWNFMFVGGTTLLTETHTPAERAKTQGVNDLTIFVIMTITSLSSGALFTIKGWEFMNFGALPVLALTAMAVMWLALQRSNSRAAT